MFPHDLYIHVITSFNSNILLVISLVWWIYILKYNIMRGAQSLTHFSPELIEQDLSIRALVSLLPKTILFHRTGDYTIQLVSTSVTNTPLMYLGFRNPKKNK